MATRWQPACNQRRTHPELGACNQRRTHPELGACNQRRTHPELGVLRLVLRVDTEHDELDLAVVLLGRRERVEQRLTKRRPGVIRADQGSSKVISGTRLTKRRPVGDIVRLDQPQPRAARAHLLLGGPQLARVIAARHIDLDAHEGRLRKLVLESDRRQRHLMRGVIRRSSEAIRWPSDGNQHPIRVGSP